VKKIEKYISLIASIILLCGWIVTVMWYGKKLDDIEQNQVKTNEFIEKQLEINGRTLMYIELDMQ